VILMTRKAKSRTERDSFLLERLVGGHHHKTTISDGKDKVEARGSTPEESQKRASKKWDKKKKEK